MKTDMSFLYSALALAAVLMSLTAVLVICVEVIAAFFPAPRSPDHPGKARQRIAVLIPAHNEATTISATLENVQAQLAEEDRLLVVADNCTDDTDETAARCGAEVLMRLDQNQRGKGFALDYGVRYLIADPPDVLIIVDADCYLHEGVVDRLAALVAASGRPVQSLYLMKQPANTDANKQVAEFAWVVKNYVRPLGMRRLGLPCHLTGTGMAFPWAVIRSADLATPNLVEDVKLGLELAKKGNAPVFCPDAVVTSTFPSDEEAVQSQRTRWEHGYLGIILSEVPAMIRYALTRYDLKLLFFSLDVAVPPLALLALFLMIGLALGALGGFIGTGFLPLYLAVIALALYAIAVLLAWSRFGRSILPFSALASIPSYILAKIPMYLRFLYKRQQSWIRTGRDRKNL